ncbi:CUB and sushi domain-containing protein 1-like isoform X2 [Sycon ciliatum]|uniref:CUB and sushi domain-containing protein 1-like isoform X2 n=1 Tax=Sycon ciliatum TaxID=27933 RepID=UPI0031F5F58A
MAERRFSTSLLSTISVWCVLVLTAEAQATASPAAWVQCPSTPHQYQYVNVSMKFLIAISYCKNNLIDARLATPTNAVENTCISQVKPAVSMWIGVFVIGNITYNTQTGMATVYSNWGPGQPDGAAVTPCVSMVGTGVGTGDKWAVDNCESTKDFVCQRTVCASRPNTIANGVITAYGTAYPNNITYQCNPGYFISGVGNQSVTGRSVFCKLDGNWSTTVISTCFPVTCPWRGTTLANGNITTYSRSYSEGIVYNCSAGFYINGASSYTITSRFSKCQANRTWSSPAPTCTAVICPWRGTTLANGYITAYSRSYSEGIVSNCSAGFYISGASSDTITSHFSKCQANRTWSSPAPTCTDRPVSSACTPSGIITHPGAANR